MHVVSGQHQFPIDKLFQALGGLGLRIVLAPAERLFQHNLGGQHLAQLKAQGRGQAIALEPVLPAVEIQIAPRRFHPASQQQAP